MKPAARPGTTAGRAGGSLLVLGCGYLGAAVAQEGLRRGLSVAALTRNATAARRLRAAGVDPVVEAALGSDAWHHAVPPAPEFVVNCVGSAGDGLDGYRESYLDGQRSVRAWFAGAGRGAGTFVYTSSTSVYPQGGGSSVDESAAPGGSERARILLAAERELTPGADGVGRWFILRLAGLYGPGRHHLLDRLRSGRTEFEGDGGHTLNLVHRDDACAAVWAALAAPADLRDEVFNVADDQPAPKREVVAWLSAQIGAPPPRFIPPPAGAAARPDRRIDATRIRRQLGWKPRYPSFRQGYLDLLTPPPRST